jgi:hypothetical protein
VVSKLCFPQIPTCTLPVGASVGSQLLSFNEMKEEEGVGAGEDNLVAINAPEK